MNRPCAPPVLTGRDRPALARVLAVGLLVLALAGGCAGYRFGTAGLYRQDVRTVYVPVFESRTYRRDLGERLTEAVVKELHRRTPFRVSDSPNADSVLRGRILSQTKRVLVENPFDEPRELGVDLVVQVQWVHRDGTVLGQRTLNVPQVLVDLHQQSRLVPEAGQSLATAQQQAIVQLAAQIVDLMELPWEEAAGMPVTPAEVVPRPVP